MGLYDQALDLGKQAVEIEEKELGSREKRMGDLYSMMAHIWDQVKSFVVAPLSWQWAFGLQKCSLGVWC